MKTKFSSQTLIAIALYLVSILCLYLTYTYQMPVVRQLRAEQTGGRQTLQQKQDKLAKLQQAASGLQAKKDQLKLLDIAVPNAADTVPVMLLQTDNLAHKAGVRMSGFTHSLQPAEQPMPITLSVAGSLTNIKSYLDALYTNLRIISVRSVALSGGSTGTTGTGAGGSTQSGEISAQIQAVTTVVPVTGSKSGATGAAGASGATPSGNAPATAPAASSSASPAAPGASATTTAK